MRYLAVLLLTVAVNGCSVVYSLQPLHEKPDQSLESTLTGRWDLTTEDASGTVLLSPCKVGGQPLLKFVPEGAEDNDDFALRPGRVQGELYVSYTPIPDDETDAKAEDIRYGFAWLQKEKDGYRIQAIDAEALAEYLHAHPRAVKHRFDKLTISGNDAEEVVLTAKPIALRRFVHRLQKCPEVWECLGTMQRHKD